MAIDAGTIKGYLDLDIGGFVDGLAEAGSKTSEELGGLEKKFNGTGSKITSSMTKIGIGMTAGITTPILGAGAAALTTAAQYDDAAAQMQASLGLTADEADNLIEIARNIYSDGFGESFDDVQFALERVYQQLGDLNDADLTYVTTGVQNLADLFDMDVNESVRGVNALMEGFGISATDAMDLLAAGAQNGLNYTDELGDNLAEYAPRFAQMGFTAEDYFQILQNGADNGAYNLDKCNDFLNEFQTALSDGRMDENIGRFSQSTQDLFQKWKDGQATGAEVYDAVINDLAGMSDSYEQAQVASALWSSLGEDNAMGMITAMSSVGDTYDDISGKSQEMADTASDSLGNQFTGIIRSVQDALADLGETGTGPLSDLLGAIQGVVDWFRNLDDGTKQTIATVALLVAAIGPVITVIGTVAGAVMNIVSLIGTLTPIITGIGAAVTGLAATIGAPVAAVVAVIAGIVAAIVAFVFNIGGFRDAVIGFFQGLPEFFSNLWNTIVTAVTEFGMWLGEVFSGIWTSITTTIQNVWNGIVTFLSGVWTGIQTTASTVFNAIATFFQTIWTTVQNIFSTIWNAIVGVVTGIWNGLSAAASTVFNTIQSVISTVLNTISSIFSTIWNTISSVVSSVWNTIRNTISNVINGIRNTISNVLNSIKSFFSNAWNSMKTTVTNAWNGIKTGVSNGINGVLNFVRNLPSRILSALGNVGNLLFNAGKSIIDGLWNGLKSAIGGVFNWVGGIANTILSLKGPEEYDKKLLIKPGEWIIQGLGEGLQDEFSNVEDQVSGMADKIATSFSDDIGKVPIDLDANMPSDEYLDKLKDTASTLKDVKSSTVNFDDDFKNMPSQSGVNYEELAAILSKTMQEAPIQNNVDVVMQDGDVIMDGERVGRKVAPVVSRVQARKVKDNA